MFLQSDWPTIAAVNLPSGGAAYPLSTPGVRLKVDPVRKRVAAVCRAQRRSGRTRRRATSSSATATASISASAIRLHHRRGAAPAQHGQERQGLSSTFKLGAWGQVGQFDDQRLLSAVTCCRSREFRRRDPTPGNNGLYAVIDQQLDLLKGGDLKSGTRCTAARRSSVRSQSDQCLCRRRHRVRRPDPSRPNERFGARSPTRSSRTASAPSTATSRC